MRKILITGGTGLIGNALTPKLIQAGYEPVILSRQNRKAPHFLLWDGREIPPSLSGEGFVAAINLVGASIANQRWSEAYKRELWESRIEPTKSLVRWLHAHAPSARLISASAVGFYGSSLSQERLTESSPAGSDFLAGLAQAWESAAQAAPVPPVIFRLGVVLSREGGAFPQLLRGFRLGVGTYFSPGVQGFSWIHIEDVVRAIIWSLEQPEKHGIYNLTAPEPISAKELAQAILKRKKGALLLPIPEVVAHVALGELATTLTKGNYVLPRRLQAEGFSFTYPTIDAALSELLPSPHGR
ncbi:MAG: TIGR01777 family oxidoreductase [Bacteroidia bacterium]|nr:TIGR01777 family oxidoreductase [Bacteroidia bacterium]MCX7651672.1 TIGR01777 family oxidoreductase [Bacteroidia bacterium]MDW8417206.1 TIGR01777 family oxidoreductase [Bacteroidia bacterium]